ICPREKTSLSLFSDQCESQLKVPLEQEPPIPHEDISENARESFRELDSFTVDESVSDILYDIRKKLHPIVLLRVSDSVDKRNTSYQCADCQYTAQNVDHLIEHHCHCHSELSFEFCKSCNTYLMKNEQRRNPVSCRFCGKNFSLLKLLKKHQRCHRGDRPYRCLECRKGFKQKAHLIGHKKIHQRRIQCTVCRKILPTIGELIQKHCLTH
uniref:C2H2-type domain-containing protein n=1 Tax=Oryzias sinensis TaxID=183150 RepID=A0A8C7ZS44_9TELE